jgi:pyrroline-5-carboxylate reductase
MSFDLVIIGGGNMGAALLGGLLAGGTFEPESVAVAETLGPRREELTARFAGVTVTADVPPCKAAVLAVKPAGIAEAARAASEAGARRLLSIAAGVPTATIEAVTGDADVAVVRAMPNTPALVGKGASAIARGASATDAHLDWAETILGAVGVVVRVDESDLDAVTALTGSGPAYLFLVAESLIEAGTRAGLEAGLVARLVAQLFVGSAALLDELGDPATLRAQVTSPGGTTAAGLAVLAQRDLTSAFVDAVAAAKARSIELAGA